MTERKGARTALVTTRGFRDVLRSAAGTDRTCTPRLPQAGAVRAATAPLRGERARRPPRDRHRAAGRGRARSDGQTAAPRQGVEAIAVCFLHSYAHPEHGRAERDRLRGAAARCPRVDRRPATSRAGVARVRADEHRVLNGYVQPVVDRLPRPSSRRCTRRDGLTGAATSMQSNGGTASVERARRTPDHARRSPDRPRASSARRGSASRSASATSSTSTSAARPRSAR